MKTAAIVSFTTDHGYTSNMIYRVEMDNGEIRFVRAREALATDRPSDPSFEVLATHDVEISNNLASFLESMKKGEQDSHPSSEVYREMKRREEEQKWVETDKPYTLGPRSPYRY